MNPAVPTDLVLVHGWLADRQVWDDLRPLLHGHRILAPTLRTNDHGGQVREVLEAAEAEEVERFVVVGHAMGGQVALRLAAARPDRVAAVVLVCPVPPRGLQLPPDLAAMFSGAGGDPDRILSILDQSCRQLSMGARSRLLELGLRWPAARVAATFRSWQQGMSDFDPSRVAAPVWVVATDDPLLRAPLLDTEVVRKVPRGRLRILHGPGHYPQMEDPASLAVIIREALADLLPG
jgi:non-heme chloroperoxidase